MPLLTLRFLLKNTLSINNAINDEIFNYILISNFNITHKILKMKYIHLLNQFNQLIYLLNEYTDLKNLLMTTPDLWNSKERRLL